MEVGAIGRLILLGTILLVFVTVVAANRIVSAEAPSVGEVTVSIQAGSAPPPARVVKRMEKSVATVGDHVLAGRKVTDVEAGKAAYEKLIKEVFDRVLVGYFVQEVVLTPGETTHIVVRIAPWGEVVRSVKLDVDPGGVSPRFADLFNRDMGNLEDKVSQVLVGMPVDSVEWAGGVSKAVIRELLAAQLPEYRANLEILPGQVTTVKLSLAPIGPVIQNVKVTLRSRTIPNFLLLDARPVLEDAAAPLRGLPVAFAERHREYFRQMLAEVAIRQPATSRYGLKLVTELRPGIDTELAISAETTKYNVTLEGYLDMGRKQDDTSARLHVGQNIGKYDELFMEVTFIPGTVSWEFAPGWSHRIGPSTLGGVKYCLSNDRALLWMKQDLSPNWSLRLERVPVTGVSEFGLRYKLHEFLSAEYIITSNEKWLRLVGNL